AADTSPDPQQRDLALAERQLLSDDWHGLADRIETALKQPGCSAPNWMPEFASAFGYGDLIENLGARVNVCDPLNGINYRTRMSVALATGHPQRALDVLAMYWKASGLGPTPTASQAVALAMLGRIGEAQTTLASMEPRGDGYYLAQLIVGKAAGEDPAKLYARLQNVDRKSSKFQIRDITDAAAAALSGNRAQANRHAAVLDTRPAGGLLLAIVVTECQCGAPFDLDATPTSRLCSPNPGCVGRHHKPSNTPPALRRTEPSSFLRQQQQRTPRMTDAWQRTKERKLVQWTVAYAAGAFALLQGVDMVAANAASG